MRRFGVFFALGCALLLAVSMAGAATVKRAAFDVTLTATLTKQWTVTRTQQGDCDEITRYSGEWRLALATQRPARVVAIAPRRGGPVRFSHALVRSLVATARRGGSTTAETRGPGCTRTIRHGDCARWQRSVRSARVAFASPRPGVLRLGRLQRAAAVFAPSPCGNEPDDVRDIRTDLNLADGPLATRNVFDPDVRRFFVTGDTEQVTTLEGDLEGTVTERVRWTLTFNRRR